MLYNILLVVLLLDAVVLIAAILLQSGKGGGLAANFGGASSSPDAFVGIRQAGTILTKATWWCGGIFLGLAFVLQIMSTRSRAPRSVLEDTFGSPPPVSAPVTTPGSTTPGSTTPVAPAVPLEPAPGAATGSAPAAAPTSGGQAPSTPRPANR